MSERMSNILQEYDDLVEVVANSIHRLYQANLSRWLSLIDDTPEFARQVAQLESLNDFDEWYSALEVRQRSHGIGSTELDLPIDREAALGMQLSLFRRMATGQIKAETFAHVYIAPSERNVDRGLSEFSKQIFIPAAKALRRHLERATERTTEPGPDFLPLAVPAADRTVTLNHNAPDYAEAMRALENVEQVVQQANDYDDPDDKEQRVAELSAGRRLLKATRVRAEAVLAVLYRALSYLAKKFVDVAIGAAATAALALLGRLTGFW
jgi:hypothetical protein